MITPADREVLKENIPFWKHLSAEEQSLLCANTVKFTHNKGDILHEDRNTCTGMIVVQEGQLRIYINGENGKEITLYRLFDRDICILSASCLIKNITFDVHVLTERPTKILRIETEVLQHISRHHTEIQDVINELISSRFSDVMWVVEQVVFMNLDRRIAMHLLEQAAIAQSEELSLTHESIARDLGTAREVITRMLSRFQEERLVELSRGKIVITNRTALYNLT